MIKKIIQNIKTKNMTKNIKTKINSSIEIEIEFKKDIDMIFTFVYPIATLLGMVFNIINAIVFRKNFYAIYAISSKNYLFFNSIFTILSFFSYGFKIFLLCGSYCPRVSGTFSARIIFLVSTYFGNAFFCLVTFIHLVISIKQYTALKHNFKRVSNCLEKIPVKCMIIFFFVYVIPTPLSFKITQRTDEHNTTYNLIRIEEEKYKLIALKLVYHGFQLMLGTLIVLNVILGFHLIKLINKRTDLIETNQISYKNNRNT